MPMSEYVAHQASRPHGLLGEIIGRVMHIKTGDMNRTGLELLCVEATDVVLEIGFGNGRTVFEIAELATSGLVAGVDPSEVMVRLATRLNRRHIRKGKVALHLGEAKNIPYGDGKFNKVIAVSTIYFWKNPIDELREIRRVITDNGLFVMEFRPKDDIHVVEHFPASVYSLRTNEEIRELLAHSGFRDIDIQTSEEDKMQISWAIARP